MASYKYIVPVLAAAVGGVAAQSSSCSVSATTTLQSAGDATALATCQTFTGSIAIDASTSGNIALDGIQVITGSLTSNNASGVAQLTGDSLTSIGADFTLVGLTGLANLDFPLLTTVGSIDWTGLPALQALTLNSKISMVSNLSITNTGLYSLDGIDLAEANTITISDNNFLTDVQMQLGNVSNSIDVSNNAAGLVAQFPNLIWAVNMAIRSVASVSIPSLAVVNASLGFYENTFANLSAPNLTQIGATFSLDQNAQLNNVSFPELTTVEGGFLIEQNGDLGSIDGFNQLKTVGGAVNMTGAFTNVSLPALGEVAGGFNLVSTNVIANACSHFSSIAGPNNVIRGKYTCSPTASTASSSNSASSSGSPTASGSGSGASPSKGAAVDLLVPSATGIIGLLAVVFGLL